MHIANCTKKLFFTFQEEEEDLIESEEDEKNENKPNGVSTHNKAWRKTSKI